MVELKLDVKKQNIQVVKDVHDEEKCKGKAVQNKKKSFGVMSVFDKSENIELTLTEKRYEPFWHIMGESFVEYIRGNTYGFAVDPQVRAVKIANKTYDISGEKPYCSIEAEDRCLEHYEKELITNAVDGNKNEPALRKYIEFDTRKIKQTEFLY